MNDIAALLVEYRATKERVKALRGEIAVFASYWERSRIELCGRLVIQRLHGKPPREA